MTTLADFANHADRQATRKWCIRRITNGGTLHRTQDVYNALARTVERQAKAEGINATLPMYVPVYRA